MSVIVKLLHFYTQFTK